MLRDTSVPQPAQPHMDFSDILGEASPNENAAPLAKGTALNKDLASAEYRENGAESKCLLTIDTPITVTRFPKQSAQSKTERQMSMRQLASEIERAAASDKGGLPWFKLASFGDRRTEKNCLRNNENVLSVSGVEADYDAGAISPDEAERRLRAAGIAAMVYTTPNHGQEGKGNRWRVFAPFDHPLPPEQRAQHVARLNGILDGALDGASFVLSQSYYGGNVAGRPKVDIRLIDGQPINQAAHLDATAIGKMPAKKNQSLDMFDDILGVSPVRSYDAKTIAECRVILADLPSSWGEDRNLWRAAGMALHDNFAGSSKGLELWHEWSRQWPAKYEPAALDKEWRDFKIKAGGTTLGTLIKAGEENREARNDIDDSEFENFGDEEAPPQTAGDLFFSAVKWAGQPAPDREWLVPDYIPNKVVTLLTGDGGTGKSLLALQLAVSVATGTSWLGLNIDRPGKVLFLSAEDDDDELHRRLESICHGDLSDLQNLMVRSVVDTDPLLATFDKHNRIAMTTLYKSVVDAVKTQRPKLLILDTLANLHSGDENNKAHAMQFVNKLKAIATVYDCAVLLLAHPSQSGMANGSGSAGSVGWNNAVRSRLYLSRIKGDDGKEADPDARELATTKANYGRNGGKLDLYWQAGRFAIEADDFENLDGETETREERSERVFLKLLDRFSAEGRYVSSNTSPTYAPTQFAKEPDAERCGKPDFEGAMRRLFFSKSIRVGEHTSKGQQRTHIARAFNAPNNGDDML